MCIGLSGFGQSVSETVLLKLSSKIFEWEVTGKIDSLDNVFYPTFIVVSSDCSFSQKEVYFKRLKSGNFIHNSIDIEDNSALIAGNTATVVGKGNFNITVSGTKLALHLSFMEVFTREAADKPWKVLAMKASKL
jgi:hypothetical protein